MTVLSVCPLRAQEVFTYDGPLTIGSERGNATYEYILQKGDTIKSGAFVFQKNNSSQGPTKVIEIRGGFKADKPSGSWEFEFGNYEPGAQKKLVDYKYITPINGTQRSINGSFKDGKPTGAWTVLVDSIVESEKTSRLFQSEMAYENGVPQRSFRIETSQSFMVGRLLRNGDAHDTWSLFDKDGVGELESWKFDESVLKNIVIATEDGSKIIPLQMETDQGSRKIALDQHYLDVMELRLQVRDTTHVFDHGLSVLLKKNAAYLHEVEDLMNEMGLITSLTNFKVAVPEYPFTKSEIKALEEIQTNTEQAQEIIESVLSNTQLNILKLTDPETDFLYQVGMQLDSSYIRPTEQLLRYYKEGVAQHITRNELLKGLWPKGLPASVIQVRDSSGMIKKYKLDQASKYEGEDELHLQQLADFTEYSLQMAEKLKSSLDQKITGDKRQKAFISEEKRLIDQANKLKQLLDSIDQNQPEYISNSYGRLKKFTDESLSQYSKMEESVTKLDRVRQLADCYDKARNLATAINKMPDQQSEIQELYQDQVWNPFTATIMDEEVKKRIVEAYNEKLIPHYLNQVQPDMDCDQILILEKDLQQLHDRMKELRKEDTKRLERKIKRTDSIPELLKLFGLSLS